MTAKRLVLVLFCVATLELCKGVELCDSDPCLNQGVCVSISPSDYVCQCMYGYAGELCEIDINFCDSNPCLHGNCTDDVFSFICECNPGFSGRQCQENINECEGEPCGDFGSCIDGEGDYTCECNLGYTGINCETNIDDCSPDPCVNGECIDGVGSYVCECAPSFAGTNCTVMTSCSVEEDTCQNNGVCNVTFEGGDRQISCICRTGYTGENCETDIDECSDNPCINGGTCNDLLGQFSCSCPMDFTGDTCSIEIDRCDPDVLPCQNGICRNGECFCRNGFTGTLCEMNIDDCSSATCFNGGSCVDMVASFRCDCAEGFSGDLCNTSTSDPCTTSPCLNGGTCTSLSSTEYSCVCPSAFTGVNCSEMIDFCLSDPCPANTTAACIGTVDGFDCICLPGYEGDRCETDVDACELLAPCANGGLCTDMEGLRYFCACVGGYEGVNCSVEIDECLSNPCQNNGTCRDEVAGYSCRCPTGYTGSECQENIDDCLPRPCQNGATCEDLVAGYVCLCPPGFTGPNCSVEVVGCSDEPCGNGATCVDVGIGFICECAPGFTGGNCMSNVDDCASSPCHGVATCVDGIDSFSCVCPIGFTGTLCSDLIDFCSSNPCLNEGTCTSHPNRFVCNCSEGYTGIQCETQLCTLDCRNDGECINDGMLTQSCSCRPGFTGSLCEIQFNVCDAAPCAGNSTCVPSADDSFLCLCSQGFTGALCEEDIDECETEPCGDNGVCANLVNGFECMCRNGFTGDLCQTNINDCSPDPCGYNSTCIDLIANYSCECAPGFEGRNCTIDTDLCDPLPCMNGGSCSQNLTQGSVTCSCVAGYRGLFCQFDIDECNTTSSPCFNGGECVNTRGGFQCVCRSGFSGSFCEEYNDCDGLSVCMNNATCVDTGNDFECICPPGFTGVICDIEINECDSSPCLNSGICQDRFLDFECICTEDYAGRVCDINLNPCSSSPCMNSGECTNGEPGTEEFSCTCVLGFTGPLCEEDINDCDSNPCPVGSTCLDAVNNFTCLCPPGFSGHLCEDNFINNCAFPYCLNGGTCIDIGADYVCICDAGFTGLNCEFGTNECLDNPCFNGGTCRDLFGGYECMCPAGFSGMACEIDIDECLGIDCNNGSCIDLVADFTCNCVPGYAGERCETDFDECGEVECLNDGSCLDRINNYTCECVPGFEGRHCEVDIDDCIGVDCGNGTCEDLADAFYCQCVMGYTGSACEVMVDECEQEPCMNGASCLDQLNNFTCLCPEGFQGRFCEVNIDDCLNVTCLNGGTCQDGISSYTCDCVFGYGGEDCGEIVDLCSSDTCSNNGTCTTTAPGVIECSCTPLFTGSACEIYIDLCLDPGRCTNGGECIPTEVEGAPGFTCNCSAPYRGSTCEIFDPCVSQPCYNNGSCVVDTATEFGYRCNCSALFIGYNCFYPNLCLLNQTCSNGGTCTNHIPAVNGTPSSSEGTTSCVCGPDFTGESCETEITPCYYEPCSNGGTCLLDPTSNLGYICQCPLYWHGTNCTQEINIVTPAFGGDSYLSHSLPGPSNSQFNYSLAFLTSEPSGLVLYLAQSSPLSYIALGLESGRAVLYVGTDSGPVELSVVQVEANDGEWHVVELNVDAEEASLQVDNLTERVSVSISFPVTETDTLVYVGGVPDFSLLPEDVAQTVGLVGCVHDRAANGQSVELAVVYHEGRDVNQCSQPVCQYIECQNGATCSDVEQAPGFTCSCPPFFSGVFCEMALPVCDPNPCLFGGVCREQQFTFSCQCPLGRGGRTCEEGITITVPSFSGDSYIAYPPNSYIPAALQTVTISLTFNPVTDSGLLFFTSTSETDFGDYFSLALVDGRVELRFNLGSGHFSVTSEEELELNTWHVVTATLSSGRGELTVDNGPLITGSSQSLFTILNTQNDIWLGGYTNFVDLTSITGTAEGFSGCVSDVAIDGRSVDFILDADNGLGVTQCDTSSCEAQPCMNSGSCVEDGPSFVCVCPPGFSGPLCSRVGDRCGSEPDLCAEGATCVNSDDGLDFSCLCPVGRDGERCDEDVDIQTPAFNLTSFLQYNPHLFDPPLSIVSLRFNSASPNGLIFYYGDHTLNRDFFSVTMIQQRVEYRYDLGSGPAVLISNPVDLDSWHYVVATLNGPSGTLTVDGGDEITNGFEGSLTVLNAAGDIFVGGVSDYGTVSPRAGTEVGFRGCVSDLEINGVRVDLFGVAVGGRGIEECLIDPCTDMECSNGGSCQVIDGSEPVCLCPLGFAGPTCDFIVEVSVPYFTGQSYLAHDSLTNVFATTSITLEVRPSSLDGLLLFNQQTDGVDYIAVLLRDGEVEFWYDLGSGPATLSSREPLELDEWHTIEVYRNGASGQLIVDDMLPVPGTSVGSLTGLQLGGPLFIGGVSDTANGDLPSLIRGVGGFRGCIRSIVSNSASIQLVSDANLGAGLEECPLLPCTENPCLNNGVCFVESGNGSTGQQCQCSLPFTGSTCSQRVEEFPEAQFNGQSYLQFSGDAVGIDQQRISTSIEISFTPNTLSGLLLYLGAVDGSISMDYLYIALSGGLVELRFDLGSGEVVALTSQPLQVGDNYTVVVNRNGGNGAISVSNGDIATTSSAATNFDATDSIFAAYLGGAPSPASLTEGTYTFGFSGCVTGVSIGRIDNTQHLPFSTATASQDVDPCT